MDYSSYVTLNKGRLLLIRVDYSINKDRLLFSGCKWQFLTLNVFFFNSETDDLSMKRKLLDDDFFNINRNLETIIFYSMFY